MSTDLKSSANVNGGSRCVQRVVRPTKAMKLKAISDIRGWTTAAAHTKDGEYDDLVLERVKNQNNETELEQWRQAYDWVDDILVSARRKLLA